MNKYPHMCTIDHEEIGYKNSEEELCPLCIAKNEISQLERLYENVRNQCDMFCKKLQDQEKRISSIQSEAKHEICMCPLKTHHIKECKFCDEQNIIINTCKKIRGDKE